MQLLHSDNHFVWSAKLLDITFYSQLLVCCDWGRTFAQILIDNMIWRNASEMSTERIRHALGSASGNGGL